MTSYNFGGVIYDVIQPHIGAGAQGTVHKVQRRGHSTKVAIAKEIPYSSTSQKRLQALLDHKVGEQIPYVSAPLALQQTSNKLSYLAAFSLGVPLEDDPPRPFSSLLEIAVHLACLWEQLEKLGIAHGDIAPSNVLIAPDGTPCLIDFDNFSSQNSQVPEPNMLGQHSMMAPEIRKGRQANRRVKVTLESDRFAWAVLLNILLLGRHPSDGLVKVPTDLDRVMTSNSWPDISRLNVIHRIICGDYTLYSPHQQDNLPQKLFAPPQKPYKATFKSHSCRFSSQEPAP